MNIVPIFPTHIAIKLDFITSKERLQLWDRIKKIDHISHKAIEGDGYSTHGKFPKFLNKNIKDRIQVALDEYNETSGNFPSKIGDQIWSNIQNAGSKLNQHSHPTSEVSGALYINVAEDDKLYFHNPNQFVYFTDKKKYTLYNYEYHSITVENCQLVLFPGWLRHGNDNVINKMDERIVISFNSSSR